MRASMWRTGGPDFYPNAEHLADRSVHTKLVLGPGRVGGARSSAFDRCALGRDPPDRLGTPFGTLAQSRAEVHATGGKSARADIEPSWQEEGLRRSPRSPGGRAQPRRAALSTRASPRRTHSPDGRHDALRHVRLPRREAGPPRARRLQGARRAGDSDAADGRQQARGPPLHRRVRRAHPRRREVLQVRPNPTLAARARPPDPPARRRATSARVPARSRASIAPAPRARTRPTRQTVPPSG